MFFPWNWRDLEYDSKVYTKSRSIHSVAAVSSVKSIDVVVLSLVPGTYWLITNETEIPKSYTIPTKGCTNVRSFLNLVSFSHDPSKRCNHQDVLVVASISNISIMRVGISSSSSRHCYFYFCYFGCTALEWFMVQTMAWWKNKICFIWKKN